MQVDGPSSYWRQVLSHLYPVHPRPGLTYSAVRAMLKIANQ